MSKEEKLTSVKVIDELYKKFREKSIRDDFSLQKVLYVSQEFLEV